MLKPICVPCRRFFRPANNGVAFIEGMPIIPDAKPGRVDEELWRPYKLWIGDRWECPDCKASIIVGTGREPVNEHYKPEFQADIERFGANLQINDC